MVIWTQLGSSQAHQVKCDWWATCGIHELLLYQYKDVPKIQGHPTIQHSHSWNCTVKLRTAPITHTQTPQHQRELNGLRYLLGWSNYPSHSLVHQHVHKIPLGKYRGPQVPLVIMYSVASRGLPMWPDERLETRKGRYSIPKVDDLQAKWSLIHWLWIVPQTKHITTIWLDSARWSPKW